MSALQSSLLALGVIALAGAVSLNVSGRYADYQPPAPNAATAELVEFADRTRAWLDLQAQNGAPADVFQHASWPQLGVAQAVGETLRTDAACYRLRAEARFVLITSAPSCAVDWTEAVQVFGASPDAVEINRRLHDGRLGGWRDLSDADVFSAE